MTKHCSVLCTFVRVAALLVLLPVVSSGQVSGPAGSYTLSILTAGQLPNFSPLVGPAGLYSVTTAGPTTVTTTATSVTISWGPSPNPVPPAPPTPVPVPTPVTANLVVIGVFDASKPATSDQTAVQGSLTIGPALKALNAFWAVTDVGIPVFSPWITYAKAVGVPSYVVISLDPTGSKGTKLEALPITTEAALVAEINRLRIGDKPPGQN